MSANVKFDLAKMTSEAQNVWLDVYGLGYQHGIERGRHLERADDEARWAWMRKHIRSVANTPDYATLADRRGDHERGERQRALERLRGIVKVMCPVCHTPATPWTCSCGALSIQPGVAS